MPYLGERALSTHRVGGWVGLRSCRDGPKIRKFFVLAGIRNTDLSTRSLITIATTLFQLHTYFIQMSIIIIIIMLMKD